jgi:succinate dehydrogenase / fumarate reductase membrane anchor subunit
MKSATGLTGSGSRDWYIQRECCCSSCLYSRDLWLDFIASGFSFEQWSGFMMTLPMKIFLYWQFYHCCTCLDWYVASLY